jgi:hypothetical protein
MVPAKVGMAAIAAALTIGAWTHPATAVGADHRAVDAASDPLVADDRALAEYQQHAQDAGVLGFYRDDASSSLVMVVSESMRDSFRLTDLGPPPVSLKVEYSMLRNDQISDANEKLLAIASQKGAAGHSMAFFFEPASEKIRVITTLDRDVVANLLGDAWPLIAYEESTIEVARSRASDEPAFWGGGKTRWAADPVPNNWCTTGFTVVDSGGTRHMVQPAHCGPVNGTVKTWSNTFTLGTYGNKHCGNLDPNGDNADVQWISGGSYGKSIYVGGATGGRADVIEAGAPAVGATYRFSGATQNEVSGQVVISTDASLWWASDNDWCDPDSPGGWHQLHLISFNRNGTCDAFGGDSGAPFFVKYAASPYPEIGIRGMVTAHSGNFNTCFAEKWPRIKSLLGNVSIYTG